VRINANPWFVLEDQVIPLVFLAQTIPKLNRTRADRRIVNRLRSTRSQLFFSEYDITGSDEYVEEEADKDRTETIVSRTSIGEKASFMKEFGVSDYDYEHRISVPLRTIMCIDLPRVDYDKGKKTKKSDYDFVKEQNRRLAEERKKRTKNNENGEPN